MSKNKVTRDKQSYLDAFNARRIAPRKLKHVPHILALAKKHRRRRLLSHAGKQQTSSIYHIGVQDWKAKEKVRTANGDCKRARADKKFRVALLRRLRDRKRNILKSPARSCRAMTQLYARRSVDNAELKSIAAKQSIILGREIKPALMPHHIHYGAIVGAAVRHDMADLALAAGVKCVRRGTNWTATASISPSCYIHEDGESKYKNGKWKTLSKATNTTRLRLFGMILTPRVLECAYHDKERVLELPEGFRWQVDTNELRVFMESNPKDDYHLSAQDMATGTVAGILSCLESNRQRRLEMAAQSAAYLADKEGVWVCLADSLRAGNCLAGSTSFAHRHGINPHRHYPAIELLGMANGDAGRVRLAITAAAMRHRKELEQGYAELAQHQCPIS